jgi:hypothetical protein
MYNDDMAWADLSRIASNQAANLNTALIIGNEQYNEWLSFQAGRTNLAIATALGKTETQVAELAACFAAFKALYDKANNQVVAQGDYLYALRKFS